MKGTIKEDEKFVKYNIDIDNDFFSNIKCPRHDK